MINSQNLNTLILLAITTYRNLSDAPRILLPLTVLSSLFRSLTLSAPVFNFPMITALPTAVQNCFTHLCTNSVPSIKCKNFNT
jgi:hypothetical protein